MSTRTAKPALVDTHIHLWDLHSPDLHYAWLDEIDDPLLGPLAELRIPQWDAERFIHETRHQRVEKVVHVQAATAPGDPVSETKWLADQHRQFGLPHAIVARADLRASDIDAVLERHLAASTLVRGVRDMQAAGDLSSPAIASGLGALERRDLSWDLHCFWEEFAVARSLAAAHPRLRVVLGHAGFPKERTSTYFDAWRTGMRRLASAENVSCKISGLGMGDHSWTVESLRPWVMECLTSFGVERCFFGSNWPVDRLYGSYDTTVAAFAELISELSDAEQKQLWTTNATNFYRL
jgi:predicted TIM-barrel fold metal-dependent hydrolase